MKQGQGAIMKKTILFSAMGMAMALSTAANAQEVGRVIASTPVVQQVAVPRQVCSTGVVQRPSSGGGAVLGAIVGGLLGNTIGHGTGRAAATGVGVIGGAAVGDSLEARGQQPVQQCTTQTTYENRTVAYNVTYEYAGKQFSVQMPNDPGPTIQLQLTPVGGAAASAGPAAGALGTGGVVTAPPIGPQAVSGQPIGQILGTTTTTTSYPVAAAPAYYPAYPAYYPAYYSPYYYPPIGLSLSFGYSSGYHHRGHWR
jgi:uncharacterized protein YcfJ